MHLHAITSCTDRKRVEVRDEARMRTVGATDLRSRVDEWLETLEGSRLPRHSVRSLYGGEHWSAFLSLLRLGNHSITGWVVSAGCGLLATDEQAPGYSATFSRGREDSVCPDGVDWSNRDWWVELGRQRSSMTEDRRSILELLRTDTEAQVVCAASYAYLDSIAPDLRDAADFIGRPDRILVLSTRVPLSITSHPFIATPTYDSRLQPLLGGSRIGLNVRVADRIIDTWMGDDIGLHASRTLERMMKNAPAPRRFGRTPATDEEIRSFIRLSLTKSDNTAASPLLRKWRDQGRACEQSRFRRLYKEVMSEPPHHSRFL